MTTTDKQYRYFKARVSFWLKLLGVMNWSVECVHDNRYSDTKAMTCFKLSSRISIIHFTKKVIKNADISPDTYSEYGIDKVAFHEVCELLLCDMTVNLADFLSERETNGKIHQVIMTLENTVFPRLREAKS